MNKKIIYKRNRVNRGPSWSSASTKLPRLADHTEYILRLRPIGDSDPSIRLRRLLKDALAAVIEMLSQEQQEDGDRA